MLMDSEYFLYSDIETVQEGEDPTIIFLLHKEFCESLNKTHDYLDCPICLDKLDDDERVILDCNHELCVVCLNKLIKISIKNENQLLCPMCRNQVSLLKTKTNNLDEVYSNLIYTPCKNRNYRGLHIYSRLRRIDLQKNVFLAFGLTGLIVFYVIMTSNSSHNLDT